MHEEEKNYQNEEEEEEGWAKKKKATAAAKETEKIAATENGNEGKVTAGLLLCGCSSSSFKKILLIFIKNYKFIMFLNNFYRKTYCLQVG